MDQPKKAPNKETEEAKVVDIRREAEIKVFEKLVKASKNGHIGDHVPRGY